MVVRLLSAFAVGGFLCAVAQILIDKTAWTPARILVGYVVAGAVLSALGWYDTVEKIGGAGATVPLLGFGHSLIKGVEKAVDEQGLFGILTGGLSGTAAGVTAVMELSLLAAVFSKGRSKNSR